jgi:hypothetical protein
MVCEVCRTGPEGETEAGALRAAEGTNFGFPGAELIRLAELVEINKVTLIESWNKVHG